MSRRVLMAAALALLARPALGQPRGHIDFCLVNVTPVAFGTFSGMRIDTTGAVTLICSGSGNNNPYTVALDQGASNSFLPRQMTRGASRLDYNLYINAARTMIWGNGFGGSQIQRGELDFQRGDPAIAILPMFARLPAQATPSAGAYSDQIRVTVTF